MCNRLLDTSGGVMERMLEISDTSKNMSGCSRVGLYVVPFSPLIPLCAFGADIIVFIVFISLFERDPATVDELHIRFFPCAVLRDLVAC